ncbi:MAG: aspartate--tRNA ligase, partial [Acidobacteriota bacterium]
MTTSTETLHHPYRTHTCGALVAADEGSVVRLSGWIHRLRDLGGMVFIDLRDHYGITQVVVPEDSDLFEEIRRLEKETVVRIDGRVRMRESPNPRLATGQVEVVATAYEVLGPCEGLPFEVAFEDNAPEETRLRYRYLDLRRQRLHESIQLRSRVIASIRHRMQALGFLEIQTPILTSSSPEGARDYLVPSRLHPGKFYALPQAPQQFKQLLMVAGFDRYFQIAPCFRDESARADRSPGEFYQLDLEMSFATQEDVFEAVEGVLTPVFREASDWKSTDPPYPRITYADAMARYGTDKPDLRNPLELVDVTELLSGGDIRAFSGKVVKALAVPESQGISRSWLDKVEDFAKSRGAAGLLWGRLQEGGKLSGLAGKLLSEDLTGALLDAVGAAPGAAIFLYADTSEAAVADIMGAVRDRVGADLDLIETEVYRFCWITDYPMYERDPETGEIGFNHNPFSMPQGGMEALLA